MVKHNFKWVKGGISTICRKATVTYLLGPLSITVLASPGDSAVKNLTAMQEMPQEMQV